MYQEFEVNGEIVRRSSRWPSYGCTQDGKVYRWGCWRRMAVGLMTGYRQYLSFRVCQNNKPSHAFLHWMLADCWLINDSRETKTQVNHINGDKLDNRLENLEWVAPAQNQQHARNIGLAQRGEATYNTELTETEVHLICQQLQQGARTKDLADEFGVSRDVIAKLRDGSTWFHIRNLYPINHKFRTEYSEGTVRWVCEQINVGVSDINIAKTSTNKSLTVIDVKRIRHKIRYRYISDEYF